MLRVADNQYNPNIIVPTRVYETMVTFLYLGVIKELLVIFMIIVVNKDRAEEMSKEITSENEIIRFCRNFEIKIADLPSGTPNAIKENLENETADIEMQPMIYEVYESFYKGTKNEDGTRNNEEIFKQLEKLIEYHQENFNSLNFLTETQKPFYRKASIVICSALFEDGAQSMCQYFYYEKYFTALDPFIFVNGALAVYTSTMFLKGIIILNIFSII